MKRITRACAWLVKIFAERRGVAARVFCALKDIHVRMVSQGASLLNISLVIPAGDVARAVESLHREFFRHPDPSAFERTDQ